jgi:hypothetical protein
LKFDTKLTDLARYNTEFTSPSKYPSVHELLRFGGFPSFFWILGFSSKKTSESRKMKEIIQNFWDFLQRKPHNPEK